MAMINCPECGKEISDKAKACIHCGCPINEESQAVDSSTQKPIIILEDSKKSAQKKLLISSILSLVASLSIIITIITFAYDVGTSARESDADINVTVSSLTDYELWDTILAEEVVPFEIVVFSMSFIFTLLTYLIKNKSKSIFAVLSIVFSVISSIIVALLFISDSSLVCIAPVLIIPCVLFLVSAFLNIIGTKEYFNNAEQK